MFFLAIHQYKIICTAACPHYQHAAVFILPGRRTRERLHVKIAHQQNQSYLPNALTANSIILYILKIAGTFHFFLSVQTWCVYNHKTMTINECITGAVLISIFYIISL